MPDTRPDTAFVNGVCSACISHANRPEIDWEARKKELLNLIDRHNGRCIVPSSGGKDSTYQAITLKKLGADVTAVTARTCHLTEVGRHNIDNLANHVRTIEYVPNMDLRKKLNRLGLEIVGDISWPEHASIFSIPFKAAVDLKIPLIFYGENPQNCYGGPIGTEEARMMGRRWVSEFGGFLGLRPLDLVGIENITERDMHEYMPPSDAQITELGVEAHFLGQYLPWRSHINAGIAARNGANYGVSMRDEPRLKWWSFENVDNAQTAIHDFFGWLKYGYGRVTAQLSVDVRNEIYTREQALEFVRKLDGLFPSKYLGITINQVLESIGVAEEKFITICNQFADFSLFAEDKVTWGKRLTLNEFP